MINAENGLNEQLKFDQFVEDTKNDQYETNTAQHYRLHLGDSFKPETRCGFIYSAHLEPDDAEDLIDLIRAESKRTTRQVKTEIQMEFTNNGSANPTFWTIDTIGSFLDGRQPVLISGASKKS